MNRTGSDGIYSFYLSLSSTVCLFILSLVCACWISAADFAIYVSFNFYTWKINHFDANMVCLCVFASLWSILKLFYSMDEMVGLPEKCAILFFLFECETATFWEGDFDI